MNQHYGTIGEATTYFDKRLFETVWSQSNAADREKSLIQATQLIDALGYKGDKHSVYEVKQVNGDDVTLDQIRTAEASQALEFPRGADTAVPEVIRIAAYEISRELLSGRDPELELENLHISSTGFSSVRTTYNREAAPIEHLINGIPSAAAWRLLRPFLRDGDDVSLSRVS